MLTRAQPFSIMIRRRFWSSAVDLFKVVERASSQKEIADIVVFDPMTSVSLIKTWKSLDDRSYGGSSITELKIGQSLKFSGSITFNDVIAKKTNATRSFCGLMGYFDEVQDLRDYQGLEISLKSSIDLDYTINLGTVSLFENDLFQIEINLPANASRTIHIPFSSFRLVIVKIVSKQ